MITRPRRYTGQAAVEGVFAIPVFAVLFLIGFQLYAVTWSAQAVNVRARYKMMATAGHRACKGGKPLNKFSESDEVQVQKDKDKLGAASNTPHKLKATAYIVCK